MQIYIVYECDMWCDHSTYDYRGTYDSEDKAKDAICAAFKEEFREDVRKELDLWGQTQGHDPNFVIEEHELNMWEGL